MSAKDETIGFIGLGAMGRGMAANCVKKGFKLVVHDLKPEPVEELVALGATAAKDAAEVARQCSIIITVLPAGKEVTETIMAPGGLFDHAKPGTLVMDLSTVEPETTDRLHAEAKRRGFKAVDAPIGRLAWHAERGESLFMVGANDGQSILEGDGTVVAQFGTPEWTDEYRRRVTGIMDLVRDGARRLIWVGEPNVGTGNVQKAVALGNQLAAEEAAERPWVTYFDLASLVAGPDGGFAEYITLPDGSTARCFAGDGVHLSVKCLDRVMDDLVPTLTGLYATAGDTGAGSGAAASDVTTTTAATAD